MVKTMNKKIFPTDLPELNWVEFSAEGFSKPVTGVIHRVAYPAACGMPLGAIDTGCIDLETDGTLGYCTVFNSHVPRRGPLNMPFLGFSVGKESWILTSRRFKGDSFLASESLGLRRAENAREIHYWGHYPVADLEYEIDAPVSVGLRAWSPFIPGDVAISNAPGAVFEVHLRNITDATQKGMLVFSFPGPSQQEVGGTPTFEHTFVKGSFSGVVVTHASGNGYALGIIGTEDFRIGGDLGIDGGAWVRIADGWDRTFLFGRGAELPAEAGQAGASVGVNFELKARDEKVVRFVLAWYSPCWKGGGIPMASGNTYTHMYASRYKNALEVARLLADQHQVLLERILAWQQVIYTEEQLPPWLRETLVNVLHLITEDGFWAQAKSPIGDWCRSEDGLFGMSESPRGCPQIECIPCSFYGNIPLVYFFPELALSTLRGYKGYQYSDGQVPWVFGGCTCGTAPCEMALPCRGYDREPQTTLDGPCYVDMVDRFWMCTGRPEVLAEFYQSVKRNTIFTMNLRPGSGLAGIVSLPSGNNGQDWIESVKLFGIVPHIGGVHLANLRMAERMAEAMGDKEFAEQCREWYEQGSKVMEEQAWAGEYYMLFNEPETGKKSDVILAYQLDGEWMARFHGLKGVFRPDHLEATMATLKKIVADHGAIVFTSKEKDFDPGYWTLAGVFVPGTLMLAMTYMYEGEVDYGVELARRAVHALVIENRCSWDLPVIIRSDTGERLGGNDYYQNLMLWSLPAALVGKDLADPCKSGGLVNRIIQAGAKNKT